MRIQRRVTAPGPVERVSAPGMVITHVRVCVRGGGGGRAYELKGCGTYSAVTPSLWSSGMAAMHDGSMAPAIGPPFVVGPHRIITEDRAAIAGFRPKKPTRAATAGSPGAAGASHHHPTARSPLTPTPTARRAARARGMPPGVFRCGKSGLRMDSPRHTPPVVWRARCSGLRLSTSLPPHTVVCPPSTQIESWCCGTMLLSVVGAIALGRGSATPVDTSISYGFDQCGAFRVNVPRDKEVQVGDNFSLNPETGAVSSPQMREMAAQMQEMAAQMEAMAAQMQVMAAQVDAQESTIAEQSTVNANQAARIDALDAESESDIAAARAGGPLAGPSCSTDNTVCDMFSVAPVSLCSTSTALGPRYTCYHMLEPGSDNDASIDSRSWAVAGQRGVGAWVVFNFTRPVLLTGKIISMGILGVKFRSANLLFSNGDGGSVEFANDHQVHEAFVDPPAGPVTSVRLDFTQVWSGGNAGLGYLGFELDPADR